MHNVSVLLPVPEFYAFLAGAKKTGNPTGVDSPV